MSGMPEVRWDGVHGVEGQVAQEMHLDGEPRMWFVAGGQHVPLTDDDVSEWVDLAVVHRVCTNCGHDVESDLVASGCPLCMACLETDGRPAPPGTVAAELQKRNMPVDSGIDVLLDLVRAEASRQTLRDVHRELLRRRDDHRRHGRGSWATAAAHVARKAGADE